MYFPDAQRIATDTLAHCSPSNGFLDWISSTFSTCVPTPLALVSIAAGLLSVASNMLALVPQLVETYRLGAVTAGVFPFLIFWFIADLCNFLGALVLDLATWQKLSEGCYTTIDVTVITQYIYYMYWRQSRTEDNEPLLAQQDETAADSQQATLEDSSPSKAPLSHFPIRILKYLIMGTLVPPASATRLQVRMSAGAVLLGQLFAVPPNICFFIARCHVLWTNYRRKGTEGIVPTLFLAAFFGNFFYCVGLLTDPCASNDFPPFGGNGWSGKEGCNSKDFYSREAPYIFGAASIALMDVFIGMQYIFYAKALPIQRMRD